ncbi:sugar ABC transporter ATP-binding protein [Microbacteriaceae bacterium K1510]|nr:sugar ABC transporter ATP-binding protein [Microbacteriaceae bacterium K1510]
MVSSHMMSSPSGDVFLSARGLSRSYGPIQALSDVSVDIRCGEVHAIVGENGAGKSTLMRLLAGEESPDSGSIVIGDKAVELSSPQLAQAHGIAIVHQQFQLVDTLTVAENIFLGKPKVGPVGIVDRRGMQRAATERLRSFGMEHKAEVWVRDLSVAERQLVEIARALDGTARLLILDEPTASLGAKECDELFRHVRRMKEQGAAIVLIAHNLDEVLAISDQVTVLRNGQKIGSLPRDSVDHAGVVAMIVGRELAHGYQKADVTLGAPVLTAQAMARSADGARRHDMTIRRGEIVGMPTYVGAMVDRTLAELTGLTRYSGTALSVEGRNLARSGIREFIEAGVCLIPGDAMAEGLIPNFSIADNILLPNLKRFRSAGIVQRRALRAAVMELIRELDIRPTNPNAPVWSLSGGNRQKVVIAKWLARGATVYVMNDPTKAVDVGAKAEIYRLLGNVVQENKAILLVSSDTDELIGLSDRIIVLRDRRVMAEFRGHPADKQSVLASIARRSVESSSAQKGTSQ